ncbi:hypothetical protein MPC1_5350001 [Methylocella tundrae]|nr:hypothetical protein MPC1_5350001 [Methylocella tundrae]
MRGRRAIKTSRRRGGGAIGAGVAAGDGVGGGEGSNVASSEIVATTQRGMRSGRIAFRSARLCFTA